MTINKNSLQARINNLSNKTGIHQNILLKSFFFDAFLKRLAVSDYSENFVFKGGFLLSTTLGISLRSTIDIDFLLRKLSIDKESVAKVIKTISSIDIGDGIIFKLQSIDAIRQEDDYGGYSVALSGRLDNIKETVSIDIVTGDPITPNATNYEYKCLFEPDILTFKAYNFETIIAEKLQTILIRGVTNSRSKDFYDLFIIHKLRWNNIDVNILKKAFENTCKYRGTMFSKKEANEILADIAGNSIVEKRWNMYRNKNKYAEGIDFLDTIEAIKILLDSSL